MNPASRPGRPSDGVKSPEINSLGGWSLCRMPLSPRSRQNGFSEATQYLIADPIGHFCLDFPFAAAQNAARLASPPSGSQGGGGMCAAPEAIPVLFGTITEV